MKFKDKCQRELHELGKSAYENVSRGDDAELKVLGSSLLELGIGASEIVIGLEHVLDEVLNLREQVDEFNVGGE